MGETIHANVDGVLCVPQDGPDNCFIPWIRKEQGSVSLLLRYFQDAHYRYTQVKSFSGNHPLLLGAFFK